MIKGVKVVDIVACASSLSVLRKKILIQINISIFIYIRGVEGEMIKGGGSNTQG
jgi:hypothetical protein